MSDTTNRKIFVISDTHFGHENILTFKDQAGSYIRDFQSVEEMDDCMVQNWNETVRPCDIVYHLGDVYFGTGWEQLKKLNGRKRLVLGNHDNGKAKYIQESFQKVLASRMFREYRAILTHHPIIIPEAAKFIWNIHGHIHGNEPPTQQHINVSVEAIGYKPIDIEEIIALGSI